jgi:hypothetical protein
MIKILSEIFSLLSRSFLIDQHHEQLLKMGLNPFPINKKECAHDTSIECKGCNFFLIRSLIKTLPNRYLNLRPNKLCCDRVQ